jgi:acetoacetate decarboxylase
MKAGDVRKHAFSMPLHSPAYPRGPYRFVNREYLIITYRTDRAALERIVPKPLEIVDAIVKYEFIRMPDSTGFGDYTDPPIAGGRELWGFPKKLASPTLRVEHDTLLGTLDYGLVRIASGSMGYKHRPMEHESAVRALGEPGFLLKIIPHVDGTPRICELVRYTLGDIELKGAWSGPAALEVHPHALAPVSDLPVLEVISAVHLIADLTLNLGKVVHDYLPPETTRKRQS